ncbi:proline-rich transmembrane protein 4 [Megalops cyprinoides]|uniref:proline-rich transmembrane protein 4 n=1 Tax=Megalops cyprinoides TaxID=118141 RepID=UPI001864DD1B|nr:proline-rich transmembrane protein 4 [Megalops cyprinoides]
MTWAEPSATPRTGTVALRKDADPPTPALPNSSYWLTPSLTTQLSDSPSSRKDATLTAARQTEASTALPTGSTSALAPGAGTAETREPARPRSQPSAAPAPVTEAAEPTFAETAGTEAKIDAGLFGEGTGAVEEHVGKGGTTRGGGGAFEDVTQAPTRAVSLSTEPSGGTPSEGAGFGGTGPTEEEEPSRVWSASVPSTTPLGPLFAEPAPDEDWPPDAAANDSSLLPDCNVDAGICNASGPWSPAFPDDNATSNQSYDPFLLLAPPMFVPLYSDWNTAMATWGLAWEAHVYGLGSLFALVAFVSVLNLLCLPFRCPSGCGYFALVNLFLLAASCSRAFSLFYDAYSHQDKLPAAGTLLLYEVPFPCLTAAFGIVFLLLSMRSRMQLSNSVFQHPCFLAVLVLLHFSATFGSVVLLQVFTRLPCLFFVSQGSFVALAAFLSAAYFAFYCYVRADAKHIYHLNNTSPPAERYHRCPFADPKDWDRAAVTAVFAALFALACAGLQLYAMLHALGLGGVEVFHPWPWWAFHLSCRVCEAGVCLTLSLVVMRPLYCSGELPQPDPGCWPRVFCAGARGRVDVKSPALPNNYQWSLSQQEKLVICDAIARRESECLPLYTLVDNRLSSLDGLDLLYPCGGLPFDAPKGGSRKSSFTSLHLDSDSTADLRPPSPINLRRSIDEALFGEALFPKSLFGTSQLRGSSELSLDVGGGGDGLPFGEGAAERGLYRTSSCVEMETRETRELRAPPPPPPEASSVSSRATLEAASGSSAERWRGSGASSSPFGASFDGSSLVLCSSPEGRGGHPSFCSSRITPGHLSQSSLNQVAQLQRRYRALGSASQDSLDQPAEQDLAVQAEFISVCRQIDALSVCSDTIDL